MEQLASAGVGGVVEGDWSAQPLERDRSNGLKADRLQRVGVSNDLVADEDLPRSGVVGDPGSDVDRAAEVVAVLEHDRAGVQADPGPGQSDLGDAVDQLQIRSTRPCAGSGK